MRFYDGTLSRDRRWAQVVYLLSRPEHSWNKRARVRGYSMSYVRNRSLFRRRRFAILTHAHVQNAHTHTYIHTYPALHLVHTHAHNLHRILLRPSRVHSFIDVFFLCRKSSSFHRRRRRFVKFVWLVFSAFWLRFSVCTPPDFTSRRQHLPIVSTCLLPYQLQLGDHRILRSFCGGWRLFVTWWLATAEPAHCVNAQRIQ